MMWQEIIRDRTTRVTTTVPGLVVEAFTGIRRYRDWTGKVFEHPFMHYKLQIEPLRIIRYKPGGHDEG